jgi:hypothetical protein
MEDFSPLAVSTTTVTGSFKRPINIVDIAKYLLLDNEIIGIKLVYAGGYSAIIRGVAKMSKKKKDFYNQVTFTIRLQVPGGNTVLVSCKIFHNGTLHITGTHNLKEALQTGNMLHKRLISFKGMKMISLVPERGYLCSFDNVLFSTKGDIIGWCNGESIYLKNEYVCLETFADPHSGQEFPVFVSKKWILNEKIMYSTNGKKIGRKVLHFNSQIAKRHFEVKFGYIYAGFGGKIIGKEKISVNDSCSLELSSCKTEMDYLKGLNLVIHPFDAFSTWNKAEEEEEDPQGDDHEETLPPFRESDFTVHMINTFFKAPFNICRRKLHKAFIDNGYYSRFDPCSNAAVNLRFHYRPETVDDGDKCGKCPNRDKICNCKDISISCFNSGKMNVTGLATIEQGYTVYEFLKKFFLVQRRNIELYDGVSLL